MSELIRNIRSLDQLAGVVRLAEARGEQVVYLGDHSVRLVKHNALEKAVNQITHQADRERFKLDNFASRLRAQENSQSGKPLLDRSTRLNSLIGKTIAAEVAARFLDSVNHKGHESTVFRSKLSFDGTGRLLGGPVGGGQLSELELTALENAVVHDLGQTNAKGERTAARTESECVLEMLGALRQARAQGHPSDAALGAAENELSSLWLSGRMSQESAGQALAHVSQDLASGAPDLSKQAQRLTHEVSKEKQLTQRHDNTFGRMFESALAKQLVDQPSAAMLSTADTLNRYLLKHVLTDQKHFSGEQNVQILAKALVKDPRPWHAEVPQLHAFLEQPNPQTLTELMSAPVTDGYRMLLTYWMAAKVSSEVSGPWMSPANDNYTSTVKPNRSSQATATSAQGVMHVAQAGVAARQILDEVQSANSKRADTMVKGSAERSEVINFGFDLNPLINAIERGAGAQKVADGSLRSNRDELIQAISVAAKKIEGSYAEAAQALRNLLPELNQSGDDSPMEVGSRPADQKVPEWEGVKLANYGTGLLHQPRPDVPDAWQAQENVPSRTGVNLSAPKNFERNALENNQNTVNGISGTTNMLSFLLSHMERTGELGAANGQAVSRGDALAGNLAFLVMDGGHSVPEAMATAASIAADPREVPVEDFLHLPEDQIKAARLAVQAEVRANRQAVLDSHVTSYSEMAQAFGGGQTGDQMTQAVQAAFESVRRNFDQFHAQR